MGQKTNPIGFRLCIKKKWDSRWFKHYNYHQWILEDHKIRTLILQTQKLASVAKIIIERAGEKCKIGIHAVKPGLIIGKKGLGIEHIKKKIQSISENDIFINIYEIKHPELNAQLIAMSIAQQIEKRSSFKRSIKRAIISSQKTGVHGIKIACAGRLGGAEMSRREWYHKGRVPLHTLKAHIDYGCAVAHTTYGLIGCKVWLYKGEF
jgi:small subunit ribosomal protein S3